MYISPGFTFTSIIKFLSNGSEQENVFTLIGEDAHVAVHKRRKTVGIFVVGETARADHFGLNGYTKNTTPLLANKNIFNFTNVTSCGTSTAYSVPCMFSFLEADDYKPERASQQSNLLDIVEKAGVKAVWRDNNSSCKGVCSRIESVNFRDAIDPDSQFYNHGEYVDEILLTDLNSYIDNTDSDILIVLHQLGSHGPAYHKRYPEKFNVLTPNCESNSPHTCTNLEVSNSYDNTILYTDYILTKTIDLLESNSSKYDSFMVYSSDHGESLGENGVYLHGLPRSIAPTAQTHVPLLFWFSDNLKSDNNIDKQSLIKCSNKHLSHDNLVHSILSLYHINTELKNPDLDIFDQACESA